MIFYLSNSGQSSIDSLLNKVVNFWSVRTDVIKIDDAFMPSASWNKSFEIIDVICTDMKYQFNADTFRFRVQFLFFCAEQKKYYDIVCSFNETEFEYFLTECCDESDIVTSLKENKNIKIINLKSRFDLKINNFTLTDVNIMSENA